MHPYIHIYAYTWMFTRTHISEHLQYCDCNIMFMNAYIQIHDNCYINIPCLFIVTD